MHFILYMSCLDVFAYVRDILQSTVSLDHPVLPLNSTLIKNVIIHFGVHYIVHYSVHCTQTLYLTQMLQWLAEMASTLRKTLFHAFSTFVKCNLLDSLLYCTLYYIIHSTLYRLYAIYCTENITIDCSHNQYIKGT